ncbi:MAG: hypothetical protein ABIQ58_00645 [Candidatus Limnocylindrales bacterium]
MRFSDWRDRSPHKDSLTPKIIAVIDPVMAALGAAPDPECWFAWGDDPGIRYMILVPSAVGLIEVHVRVNVPQEGPRVSGKLVRWNRVQVGELAIEMAGGHRLLTFQVESQVLRGSDADADAIAAFARELFAAIDGRIPVATTAGKRGSAVGKGRGVRATPEAATPKRPPAPLRLPAPRDS